MCFTIMSKVCYVVGSEARGGSRGVNELPKVVPEGALVYIDM